jgi:putative membrane protein
VNQISTTNELARERNKAAADRTLMAWIRTSIAMIGFGFGIGKLSGALEKTSAKPIADPIHSAQIFGEAFITLGVLSLLAAVVQYWRTLNRISIDQFVYTQSRALPMITAILLLVIGLFAFIAVLL